MDLVMISIRIGTGTGTGTGIGIRSPNFGARGLALSALSGGTPLDF